MHTFNTCNPTPGFFPGAFFPGSFPNTPFNTTPNFFNPINPGFNPINPGLFTNSPFGLTQPNFINPVSPFGFTASFQNTLNPFGLTQPFNTFNTFNPLNTLSPFGQTPANFWPVSTPWSQWNSPLSTLTPWNTPVQNFPGVGPIGYGTIPTNVNPWNTFGAIPSPVTPWNTYGYAGVPTIQPNGGIGTNPASLIAQTLAQPVTTVRPVSPTINGTTGQVQNGFNPMNGQPTNAPGFTYLPGYNPLATITPWFGYQPSFGFNPMTPWGMLPFGQPMTNVMPMQTIPTGQIPLVNPTLCREAA